MKLVVNAYMSILIEGVAETLELADRLGVDDVETVGGHRGWTARRSGGGRQAPQDGARGL